MRDLRKGTYTPDWRHVAILFVVLQLVNREAPVTAAAVRTCTAESSQRAAAETRRRENKFSAIFPSSRPSGAVRGWSGYGAPGATYRYPESSHVLPADCLVSCARTVSATALVSSPDDVPAQDEQGGTEGCLRRPLPLLHPPSLPRSQPLRTFST